MINSVSLKFGSSEGEPPLTIPRAAVTVIVGPNYSGKSKLISEIVARCTYGQPQAGEVIIDNISFEGLSKESATNYMDAAIVPPKEGQRQHAGHVYIDTGKSNRLANYEKTISALIDPATGLNEYTSNYLSSRILTLTGKNRISLIDQQSGGDLQISATTSFQKLFRNDKLRAALSEIVFKAFGLYLVVDPTNLGNLRLRLSAEKPSTPEIERGLSQASVQFHASAIDIALASDGAKAFVGMLSEIWAGAPEILFVDEPEAFLHPHLAFLLGREVAQSMAATGKQMFASTHSPDFLMGCVQSGVDVNVIRLTYRKGISTARMLPSADLVKLMRNPLLRSANVLSALFYESVVVTEADPDRVFYQEINERLLFANDARGIDNCRFLNAQNKQTIPTIIKPLRDLGIPAAGIFDIDVVKDGGKVATRLMDSGFVPSLSQHSMNTHRISLLSALTASGKDFKKDGGINVLSGADKQAAEDFLAQLSLYGLFAIPGGELESWLQKLGIVGHGPTWLIPMLECMGEDAIAPGYVGPEAGDVWDFIGGVRAWLTDEKRRGIPS